MRECLTNPQYGYYTSRSGSASGTAAAHSETEGRVDQFGRKGDFITSPEISQVFGELVGIWFLTEWMAQGRRKSGVQVVELGPGRGTLMDDMLRTLFQFSEFMNALEGVWLVEASSELRLRQKDTLCGSDARIEWDTVQGCWEAKSKYSAIPVRWVEDINLLPEDETKQAMPLIVAHEFFDALPIHAFEVVPPRLDDQQLENSQILGSDGRPMSRRNLASKLPQWRELLVTPTQRKFGVGSAIKTPNKASSSPEAEFTLTVAKASTPNSLIMPERPRYQKLKSLPGSRVEISPESSRYISDIAMRIGGSNSTPDQQPSGACLIIDYGPPTVDQIPINTLRAIKSHRIISPFSLPGHADLSADVDFGALVESACTANPGVECHGPVEQGQWLLSLGGRERVDVLTRGHAAKKDEMETAWNRLVDTGPRGMGKSYKVLAVVPEKGGRRRPVGFGGDVVE